MYDCLHTLNKLSLLDVEAIDEHASFYFIGELFTLKSGSG
jgi:hypothetical protein